MCQYICASSVRFGGAQRPTALLPACSWVQGLLMSWPFVVPRVMKLRKRAAVGGMETQPGAGAVSPSGCDTRPRESGSHQLPQGLVGVTLDKVFPTLLPTFLLAPSHLCFLRRAPSLGACLAQGQVTGIPSY